MLSLVAAPTFALMALLCSAWGGGPDQLLCAVEPETVIGDMVTMYLLMGILHLPPWLRLIDLTRGWEATRDRHAPDTEQG
ncbi:hypothetical protein [Ensifer sp. MJa1]|uniref:hypothetical protein n=1 Tax=Ensifer sp. MJa1 TaxID=2919888 RepID=UPI00300A9CCC